MPRKPSAETEVRNLRSENRQQCAEIGELRISLAALKTRAAKAEQEAAEWKRRFDVLLSKCRTVEQSGSGHE